MKPHVRALSILMHRLSQRGVGRVVAGAVLGLSFGLLGGCDLLGIETPEQLATKKEAEGKAVGSACRHAMRAIEDCYVLNPKALKSAVFAGWREMDEYMRENKLEGIAPVVPASTAVSTKSPADEPDAEASARPSKSGKGGQH